MGGEFRVGWFLWCVVRRWEDARMNSFFAELGRTVRDRWKQDNFSLERFPAIAQAALEERRPSEHVEPSVFLHEFLMNDDQPAQTESGFGEPEIVVFEHPRFYIQVLFWMDGTTAIHQHEFSGAFHVWSGSSLHALFEFENARRVTPYLRMGDVRMKGIRLLEAGCTVPIVSGAGCIHSLFHLDTPSITVVLRTQHDPGTGPQFNYLPPHVAVDPVFSDTLTLRRKQILDLFERVQDPAYSAMVGEMLEELDFERGFHILQSAMGCLRDLGTWDEVLGVFKKKHGELAEGVAPTLEEGARRDTIKAMRCTVQDPEHRFFLALLMNAPTRGDVLALVAQRFPEEPPMETVLRWAGELLEEGDYGVSILDASFPLELEIGLDEQAGLWIEALRYFMEGGTSDSTGLQDFSGEAVGRVRAALASSSLRVLLE